MEINIDEIERKEKKMQEIAKEEKKDKKKFNNKIKLKMGKTPINKKPVNIPRQQPPPESNNSYFTDNIYQPTEWLPLLINGFFDIISLPAKEDRKEFKEILKNSNDMNQLLKELPVDMLFKLPRAILYSLSYASHLVNLKTRNKINNCSNIQLQEVKEDDVDDLNEKIKNGFETAQTKGDIEELENNIMKKSLIGMTRKKKD